ncbi:MAG: CoA-binding protein [Acidobacteriota bacterium]|nr:CoA-binding protein [Acidobacteriota bacterium]
MVRVPEEVRQFLAGRRFVVAGVSRNSQQPANAIFRKLQSVGYDVLPVNPHAPEVEGVRCYPDVTSVPGAVDGVVVVTHPGASADIVRQSIARGVDRIWFHRSFGEGSVSNEAVRACETNDVSCIVGGCPLMYCEPVDIGHRCMRWWLDRRGRLPR